MTALQDRPSPAPVAALLFVIVAAAIICMALLGRFSGFTIYDDAYAYVRYADHLLAGEGMVWNVGESTVFGVPSLAYLAAVIPFRLLFPDNPAVAVFSASFFWGLMALTLMVWLVLKVIAARPSARPYLVGMVLLTVVAGMASLRVHFGSGLETTLLMAYAAAVMIAVERVRSGKMNPIWAGVLMGLAWLFRPDMVLLGLGLPVVLALLELDADARKRWLRLSAVAAAGLGLCLGAATLLTGDWLPTTYLLAGGGLFAAKYLQILRFQALGEAARFFQHAWPAMLLLGMGLFLKWGRLREAYRRADAAVALVLGLGIMYYALLATQYAAFGQRYYFVLLPLVIYLAARELTEFDRSLAAGPGLDLRRLPPQWERIGLVGVAGVLLYYGVAHGYDLRQADVGHRLAVFDAAASYRKQHDDTWAGLERLRGLPDGLRVASTELGIPSAVLPGCRLYDLSGCHTPALLGSGYSADAVLKHCHADLIYLPVAQFERLNRALDTSAKFDAEYAVATAERLDAKMGVAILEDSPYAPQLKEIFGL